MPILIFSLVMDHCFWTGLLTKIPSVMVAMWLRFSGMQKVAGVDFWTKIFYNLKNSG